MVEEPRRDGQLEGVRRVLPGERRSAHSAARLGRRSVKVMPFPEPGWWEMKQTERLGDPGGLS